MKKASNPQPTFRKPPPPPAPPKRGLSGTCPSDCSLPDDLRGLRYHLKEAMREIDNYTTYNDAGKRYIVMATDMHLVYAFKHLKHFEANDKHEGRL